MLNNINVLFVDDEQDTLKAIARFLRREPLALHFAENASCALSIMAKTPIHILVTDLTMPGMDGVSLLKQVKERYPDAVRLALSASLQFDHLLHCINTGEIFRYITKPAKPEELKEAVRNAVEYFLMRKDRIGLVHDLREKNDQLHQMLEQEKKTEKLLRDQQLELEARNKKLLVIQAELEAATARYIDLYNSAPVGYCTLSENGSILEANLTAATMLGVPSSALNSMPFSRFISKEDLDQYHHHYQLLLSRGEMPAIDIRMMKTDSTVFWVQLAASVTQDNDGLLICRIVMSDITKLKHLEMEKIRLETRNRRLQKAESLGRMAGAIAHHFNNHLQTLMGYLEIAMAGLHQNPEILNHLGKSMDAANRAAEVCRLMLVYLGQSFGKQDRLDLCELCSRSVNRIRPLIPESVNFNADLPVPGPTVMANEHHIQIVLEHLMTNAWEAFGENTGTLYLTAKTVFPADIPASGLFPPDWKPQNIRYACMEIADTAGGITESDIEKLFDPFFTSKFTGRGMGLPIVLGIVRAHKGAIVVESKAGQGSIFRVYLPVTAGQTAQNQMDREDILQTGKSGTILLIEDDEPVRIMTRTMLNRLGFTVLEATDGIEAMELFRKNRKSVCCVLSDLMMPRMDGWELLSALHQISPGLPVVLTSGYDETQVLSPERTECPDAFLGKPYRLKALESTINRVLTGKETGRQKKIDDVVKN